MDSLTLIAKMYKILKFNRISSILGLTDLKYDKTGRILLSNYFEDLW